MVKNPLVTIITPSFNQAAFLEKTIKSVLEQDYSPIEYMAIDGGSNDGSVDIIKNYSSQLTWWVSEKDSGQAEAINKGLSRAKGEIIAWLNSDDYLMPGAITSAVKALGENPQASFVYGDVRVVTADGTILNTLHYRNWTLKDLMSFHIIGQPAVFMRRSALEKTGFLDLEYHFLLDHQLWIRLASVGEMRYVPQLWASAHYHEDCKNLKQAAGFGKEALRIAEWMPTQAALQQQFNQHHRKIIAGANRINGFYLLDAKEYRKSFRAYLKSFFLDPCSLGREWYRMVFALFAPLGLEKLKSAFINRRVNQQNSNSYKDCNDAQR
jgi:glycosyltransferase involved in cell wall biosynthesis